MDNPADKLRAVAERRRQTERAASELLHQEASRKRLAKIIERKLRTAFIGALSAFEATFGRLWGIDKHESECTRSELLCRDAWNACRTRVLDNGNMQLRSLQTELELYTIEWNRYVTFVTKNGGEEDGRQQKGA